MLSKAFFNGGDLIMGGKKGVNDALDFGMQNERVFVGV